MFTDLEEQAFIIVDNYLTDLIKSSDIPLFNMYGASKQYIIAKQILEKYDLINYRAPGNASSIVDITTKGLTINKNGGIRLYLVSIAQKLEEKENLELQKLRSENKKLLNDLVEFRTIKSQRNWLFIISIAELLAIFAGIILQLKGQS